MDQETVRKLLAAVRRGSLPVAAAAEKLAALETADLGIARIDHQRELRRGMPEVVFGQGKSREHLLQIAAHVVERGATLLATRVDPAVGPELADLHPRGTWNPLARTFLVPARRPKRPQAGPLIVSAGTADLPVAEEAAVSCEALGFAPERLFDVGVAGIHRLLEASDRLRTARTIIVVAGMEGALPSVVAGLVDVPVIGVPTSVGYGAALDGFTALFGMLTSCASGLTVVNIDNGFGAACAACQILRHSRPRRRGRD